MTNLIVSLLQYDIVWEDKHANFLKIAQMVQQIESTNIVVLPEMFSTGFTMNVALMAETMDGQTVEWMKKIAKEKDVAVCGSIIVRENSLYFNRLLFVHPDGLIDTYDKRHLFTMGNEQKYYSSGKQKLVVEYKGFRIFPLVCYDLRFPGWSRNQGNFDLMIYIANWPAPRQKAWKTLLKARAIENQSYLVGVNRTGSDANGIKYAGGSFVIDAKGKIIQKLPNNQEGVITEKFSLESLLKFRRNFPVLDDADQFKME